MKKLKILVFVSILYTLDLLSVLNFLPLLIGAGTSLIGGLIAGKSAKSGQQSANATNLQIARETNLANENLQRMANEANAALALENREFQADFSRENREWERAWEIERATNAHQWAMQDLKAAGLNPILAAGSPAQTGGINANAVSQQAPQMQAATHQRAEVQNANALSSQIYANSAKEIFGMVMDYKRLKNESKLADSQIGLHSAQGQNLISQSRLNDLHVKHDTPGTQKQLNIASAESARAQASHLRAMEKEVDQRMKESQQKIREMETQIEYWKQQMRVAKSQEQVNYANKRYTEALEGKALAETETENYRQSQMMLDIMRDEFNVPRERMEGKTYGLIEDLWNMYDNWINGVYEQFKRNGINPRQRGGPHSGGR